MRLSQPGVAENVVPFVARPRGSTSLSAFDRQEIAGWGDYIARAGFDRVVIHACDPAESMEVGNYVALYRRGEAWAHYLFARKSGVIIAWCAVSSADIGEFPTIGDAFRHVLSMPAGDSSTPCPPANLAANVVTDLMPRLRRAAAG